jgi:hypothetical protein
MKQKMTSALIAFSAVMCLNSCVSPSEEKEKNKTLYDVSFSMQLEEEILPFSRSMPEDLPTEPTAEPKESKLFERIEYILYNCNEKTFSHTVYTDDGSNDDFGVYLYDTLEVGSYKLTVLLHSSDNVSFSGNNFSSEDLSDTFYASINFDVSVDMPDEPMDLKFKRFVSLVEFVPTDEVPQAGKLIITSEQYNTIILPEGSIDTPVSITKEYDFADEETSYSFYTFVPETEGEEPSRISKIELMTQDANGTPLRRITISNAPIVRNCITRYKGILFAPAESGLELELSIENGGEWDEVIDIDIP